MTHTLSTIDTTEKLLHGSKLKYADGAWSCEDRTMTGAKLLVLHQTRAVQHWQDGKPLQTYCEDNDVLPDVEELNLSIPQDTWEIGLDGQPRPPWVKQWVIYLLEPQTGELFTHINGTVGLRIAYDKLADRIKWMAALRGKRLFPIIELGSAKMKTRIGAKQRPDLRIVDWMSFGGEAAPALGHATAAPALLKPAAAPSVAEELSDEIPF